LLLHLRGVDAHGPGRAVVSLPAPGKEGEAMVTAKTCLGPYQILSPLGAGAMGEVYRALDLRLNREVAVKILPQHLAEDREALGRFQREARALAALCHAHILTVHDCGTDQGVTFLVTELLQGETLRDRLASAPLPWQKALAIGQALAEGLAAAHARGIIHRDLKPDNIFLTADGGVKILDFGLVRLEQKPAPPEPAAGLTLTAETEPGVVMGTVPYMAPEQVLGLPVDARSDIFALGGILYEMVTGKGPFARLTAPEIRSAILTEEPQQVSASGKQIPPELERVIRHCLEKKPEERFQSTRDLAFDLKAILTGSGISGGGQAPAAKRPRRWRLVVAGLAVLVLVLLVAAALYRFLGRDPSAVRAIESVAVLPFVNEGPDHDTEFLSDGLTESIINNLSQLPNLRVIARSSVFRYKGRETDALAAGREFGVQAVLMGRVVQRGDNLSVSVELVEVGNNRQLWGEKYNRKLADLLAVQEEISREITDKLRLRLTGEEQQRLSRHHTENPEAFQAYLVGRYHWNKRTEEGLKKAIDSFDQALRKDPAYALAHAGLADCYALLADYAYLPPNQAFPKASAAAKTALKLDEGLAEAHASLAFVKVQYEWDWAGAERDFLRALELNPNYATAHQWYSEYLSAMGRHDAALAEIKRARELDPLSPIIHAVVGRALYFARRYEEAIGECRQTLQMEKDFGPAHLFLGRAYVQQRQYDAAVAALQEARRLLKGTAITAEIGHAYAVAQKKEAAQQVLAELKEVSRTRYVSSGRLALVYAALGDKDRAIDLLEEAYRERSDSIVFLKVEPRLDPLRQEPRFADLLRRAGLAP
jgi:serine/threonine-protein kinase